ncbi:hypothetical protein GDO86_005727 [Hymenochirus boettgeri]|uniref:Uncharacterized protein n=1 Tax=Hymenochirus boettgeri TaxID=247094 RepID=A0A8T2J8B8_9PIPI|nr:hypothetical protein GDO86_005727 [Hymenochirus boettgeri]
MRSISVWILTNSGNIYMGKTRKKIFLYTNFYSNNPPTTTIKIFLLMTKKNTKDQFKRTCNGNIFKLGGKVGLCKLQAVQVIVYSHSLQNNLCT